MLPCFRDSPRKRVQTGSRLSLSAATSPKHPHTYLTMGLRTPPLSSLSESKCSSCPLECGRRCPHHSTNLASFTAGKSRSARALTRSITCFGQQEATQREGEEEGVLREGFQLRSPYFCLGGGVREDLAIDLGGSKCQRREITRAPRRPGEGRVSTVSSFF